MISLAVIIIVADGIDNERPAHTSPTIWEKVEIIPATVMTTGTIIVMTMMMMITVVVVVGNRNSLLLVLHRCHRYHLYFFPRRCRCLRRRQKHGEDF